MKKILSLAIIALVSVSTFAQRHDREMKRERPNLTTEQMADLRTKKMTLALDLNERQQKQILEINKKMAAEHKKMREARKTIKESGKKPSSDEIYKKKSERLDKMIAHKAEMKKILTPEQYEKWQKMAKRKAHKMKGKRGKKGKRRHREGDRR